MATNSLYVYVRPDDRERVEILAESNDEGLTYIIREGASQDSVTSDRSTVDAFRLRLVSRGFRPILSVLRPLAERRKTPPSAVA